MEPLDENNRERPRVEVVQEVPFSIGITVLITVFRVDGFGGAVERLENANREGLGMIDALLVDRALPPRTQPQAEEVEQRVVANRRDGPEDFGRFVELLSASRAVRCLVLRGKWSGLPGDDMERLFRDVLPTHPTLQCIDINICDLPITYFRMLTENVPTTAEEEESSLQVLGVNDGAGTIDPAFLDHVVQAIADMLTRNAALAKLDASLPLTADQCRLICQALPPISHLTSLDLLHVDEVRADTLEGAVASTTLRRLRVSGSSFSADAVPSLARQLRTNETITTLYLWDESFRFDAPNAPAVSQALLDLVSTYNYTLEDVTGNHVGDGPLRHQFQSYLRRNGMIRNVLQQLQTSSNPGSESNSSSASLRRVVPRERLPILLDRVSDVPTALYRVLKMGYGVEVSDCIRAKKWNGSGPWRWLRRLLPLRRRRRGDDD